MVAVMLILIKEQDVAICALLISCISVEHSPTGLDCSVIFQLLILIHVISQVLFWNVSIVTATIRGSFG